MTVLWTNGPTADESSSREGGSGWGDTVEQVVPMAEALGAPEALREVAATGEARHLRADVVSTTRGSMALVTSVYRLPDGTLLVLSENTWVAGREATGGSPSRRSGRRAR
jgi:hypothetical protein